LGGEHLLPGREFEELDGGVTRAGRKGIGEPGAVRRPGEVFGAPALAPIGRLQRALVEIADEHFVAMVRDCQPTTAGGGLQRDHPANVPAKFAWLIAFEDFDPFLARGVADGDKSLTIG
jgi:hypothetical protein